MTSELQVKTTPSQTVKALLKDASGNIWNGTAYVADSSLAAAGYAVGAVSVPEKTTSDAVDTGDYIGDIPGGALSACAVALYFFGTPTPGQVQFATQQIAATPATLATLPSIPANWITASGINAGALNGKGDWATATNLAATNTTVNTINATVTTNLNAPITSRMATYTQPTGFLAATFPSGTIANTTNITGGTITTVTNLTNAPTAGDFTAAMKTSLNAATPAIGVVSANVTQWLGQAVQADANNLPLVTLGNVAHGGANATLALDHVIIQPLGSFNGIQINAPGNFGIAINALGIGGGLIINGGEAGAMLLEANSGPGIHIAADLDSFFLESSGANTIPATDAAGDALATLDNQNSQGTAALATSDNLGTAQTSLNTLTTRIPKTLTFDSNNMLQADVARWNNIIVQNLPANFSAFLIQVGTGYVTSTNGGGGGGGSVTIGGESVVIN